MAADGARLRALAGLGSLGLGGAAAWAGQSLVGTAQADTAPRWLIAAALFGLAGLRLLESGIPSSAVVAGIAEPRPVAWRIARLAPRRRVGGLGLLGLGGLLALLATWLVLQSDPQLTATATSAWLLGLGAAAAGALALSRPFRLAWRQPTRATLLEAGLLLGILAVAVGLRLPNLAAVPAFVHGDEASIGLDARLILAGRLPAVFAVGWYEVPALSFAIAAVSMRVFGDDLFGLRMASLVQGTVSIGLLYLLARRVWGARPALLAAAFMAIAAWHIHFSRTGFHYMQALVATLLVLYFLVRGVQDRRLLDWLLCGFSIGLCVEVYYAARLAPFIVVVYLGYRVIRERGAFLRAHLAGLVALGVGAVVFLAPMAAVYAESPHSLNARTNGVLVTGDENLRHELDAYHVGSLREVLAIQVDHTLEAFNIRGETSLQYGHPAPLLDPWTGGLLALSALAVLLRLGSASGLLLAAWVWLTLLVGSVLTVDALFSPRVLAALPGLVLGPALLLEGTWRGIGALAGRRGTLAFGAFVLVVLGLALQSNVHDYFDVQVTERAPADRFTLLAAYARTLQDRYRLYTIGRDDWTLRYETPRFLVPNVDAVDVRNASLPLPLDRVPPTKGVAFLVENPAPDFAQRMQAIQQAYPHGREQVVSERPGSPVFTIYLVDPPDLQAANPGAKRE